MRPVHHNAGVNGGRELREFVDEHDDQALEMRLFVRFDTAGVADLNEVRIAFPRLVRASKRSTGPTALANGEFLDASSLACPG